MDNFITILIDNKDLGNRIDLVIKEKNTQFSRTQLQKLIDKRKVFFNDEIVSHRSFKIKKEGKILIKIPEIKKLEVEAQNIKLDVIFENNDYIIVNKPSGMVVHPGAGNIRDTLVNALLFHCKDSLSGIGGIERPGIIHRLDKMTSGIVIAAKNDLSHQYISTQFKSRSVQKYYEAFVWNKLKQKKGKIINNIKRSPFNRKKMSITNENNGKKAITEYELIKEYKISENLVVSWVSVRILTGRTHQIRVHFSEMGNHLVGDALYKKKKINLINENFYKPSNIIYELEKKGRQALHAKEISIYDPADNVKKKYTTNLPSDLISLKEFLKSL